MRVFAALTLSLLFAVCAAEAQTPAEACASVEQLGQDMSSLRDTFAAHEARYTKAIASRDAARDALLRNDGALQKFFAAMRSLEAKETSAALQKAITAWQTQGDVAGPLKTIYGPQELLKSATAKEGVRAAVQRGNEMLDKAGDPDDALKGFSATITPSPELSGAPAKLTGGVAVAARATNEANALAAVIDAINTWTSSNDAAAEARTHLDEVYEQMNALQLRINTARSGCPSAKAEAPLPGMPAGTIPSSAAARAIWERLLTVQQGLQDVPMNYEAAARWMLPFLFDEAGQAGAPFTARLLEVSMPRFEMIRDALAAAVFQQEPFKQELENAIPKGTK